MRHAPLVLLHSELWTRDSGPTAGSSQTSSSQISLSSCRMKPRPRTVGSLSRPEGPRDGGFVLGKFRIVTLDPVEVGRGFALYMTAFPLFFGSEHWLKETGKYCSHSESLLFSGGVRHFKCGSLRGFPLQILNRWGKSEPQKWKRVGIFFFFGPPPSTTAIELPLIQGLNPHLPLELHSVVDGGGL